MNQRPSAGVLGFGGGLGVVEKAATLTPLTPQNLKAILRRRPSLHGRQHHTWGLAHVLDP